MYSNMVQLIRWYLLLFLFTLYWTLFSSAIVVMTLALVHTILIIKKTSKLIFIPCWNYVYYLRGANNLIFITKVQIRKFLRTKIQDCLLFKSKRQFIFICFSFFSSNTLISGHANEGDVWNIWNHEMRTTIHSNI